MPNLSPGHWFLSAGDIPRRSPAYTEGNDVTAFIDGADYMADLNAALATCDRGLYLSGWRFTGAQWLNPAGSPQMPVIDAVLRTIPRGAKVRTIAYLVSGSGWPGPLRVWHPADNRLFCEALVAAGQQALLDGRLSSKPLSSHHQKFVLVETSNPDKNHAYLGGIDLCFDRWDTPVHSSAAARQRDIIEFYIQYAVDLFGGMPAWLLPLLPIKTVVSSYQPSMPGWHDVQARVRGPAVRQVWSVFADRWNDSRPANSRSGLEAFRTATPLSAPPALPTVAPGTAWVQVLQTLPCGGVFPFAVGGEQTVQAAYAHAIGQAQHYIYIEDQYLWPSTLVDRLDAALRRNVHVVMVIARDYDLPGLSSIHQGMRRRVINQLRAANAGYFKVFHLQQPAGGQIYVHSKTMIIDDAVAFIGSANLNHRSMTNDTELHIGVVDSATLSVPFNGRFPLEVVGKFAHEYRRRLWAEHLQVPEIATIDPIATINTLWAVAPTPGGRAVPHVVGADALDVQHLAELIVSLFLENPNLPPIPSLPPGMSVADVAAALVASRGPIIQWLEDVLNPRLVC
jgi:phosphatidylserine/phosphatidylglycerophosphate/cardiolipin synthase-like enzyme